MNSAVRTTTILLSLVAVSPGAADEADTQASDVAAGKQVYDHWCAPCHAPTGMMAGTIALEAKYQGALPAALEARTDLNADFITYYVRNGITVMPPFRKTEISDEQLARLVAYLMTAPAHDREKQQ